MPQHASTSQCQVSSRLLQALSAHWILSRIGQIRRNANGSLGDLRLHERRGRMAGPVSWPYRDISGCILAGAANWGEPTAARQLRCSLLRSERVIMCKGLVMRRAAKMLTRMQIG